MDIKRKILDIMEMDCRVTNKKAAELAGCTEDEVRAVIRECEDEGVILGYKALIDWDKTEREYVTALIELKVRPQRDGGFDKIAEQIEAYPEVQSVYLMSGGYDISVVIEGRTMRQVAAFVSENLACMENIISTATHFVLRKYKEKGIIYSAEERADKRENIL